MSSDNWSPSLWNERGADKGKGSGKGKGKRRRSSSTGCVAGDSRQQNSEYRQRRPSVGGKDSKGKGKGNGGMSRHNSEPRLARQQDLDCNFADAQEFPDLGSALALPAPQKKKSLCLARELKPAERLRKSVTGGEKPLSGLQQSLQALNAGKRSQDDRLSAYMQQRAAQRSDKPTDFLNVPGPTAAERHAVPEKKVEAPVASEPVQAADIEPPAEEPEPAESANVSPGADSEPAEEVEEPTAEDPPASENPEASETCAAEPSEEPAEEAEKATAVSFAARKESEAPQNEDGGPDPGGDEDENEAEADDDEGQASSDGDSSSGDASPKEAGGSLSAGGSSPSRPRRRVSAGGTKEAKQELTRVQRTGRASRADGYIHRVASANEVKRIIGCKKAEDVLLEEDDSTDPKLLAVKYLTKAALVHPLRWAPEEDDNTLRPTEIAFARLSRAFRHFVEKAAYEHNVDETADRGLLLREDFATFKKVVGAYLEESGLNEETTSTVQMLLSQQEAQDGDVAA